MVLTSTDHARTMQEQCGYMQGSLTLRALRRPARPRPLNLARCEDKRGDIVLPRLPSRPQDGLQLIPRVVILVLPTPEPLPMVRVPTLASGSRCLIRSSIRP